MIVVLILLIMVFSAINTCAKLSADNTFTGINTFSKKMVGQIGMDTNVSAGSGTKLIAFIPMMSPDKENLSNGIRLRIECFDANCLYEIFVSTGTGTYTSSSPPSSTDFYFNVLNKTNYDRARNVYLLYYNNPTIGVAGIGIYTDGLSGSRQCMYRIVDNSRSSINSISLINNSVAPSIASNPPVANQDNVVWVITAPNVSYANTTKDNTFTGINTFERNAGSTVFRIKAHDLSYTPGSSVSNNYDLPFINYVENGNNNTLAQLYFKLKTDKTTDLRVGTLNASGGLDEDTVATEKKNNTFSGINTFTNVLETPLVKPLCLPNITTPTHNYIHILDVNSKAHAYQLFFENTGASYVGLMTVNIGKNFGNVRGVNWSCQNGVDSSLEANYYFFILYNNTTQKPELWMYSYAKAWIALYLKSIIMDNTWGTIGEITMVNTGQDTDPSLDTTTYPAGKKQIPTVIIGSSYPQA